MKKLAAVLVVVVVGLLGYNYATTGEFKLVPSFSNSEEEQAVLDLREDFATSQKQFAQAHRMAGLSGIDTSSDVSAAVSDVKRIKRQLEKLRKNLTEDKAKRIAGELANSVKEFERTL